MCVFVLVVWFLLFMSVWEGELRYRKYHIGAMHDYRLWVKIAQGYSCFYVFTFVSMSLRIVPQSGMLPCTFFHERTNIHWDCYEKIASTGFLNTYRYLLL